MFGGKKYHVSHGPWPFQLVGGLQNSFEVVDPQHHGFKWIQYEHGLISDDFGVLFEENLHCPNTRGRGLVLPSPPVSATKVKGAATSLQRCMAQCLLYLKCQGVQYHPTSQTCETRHKGQGKGGKQVRG